MHAVSAGQGLCLAIEDAVVLAWHLRRLGLNPKALRRYVVVKSLTPEALILKDTLVHEVLCT